ncbi:MAG TPA: hypothetical protein VEH84_14765 [Alphaproteobacteria bacterium]|nr:hypothetical protein [Alphaproteobacteria bacterium]
MTYRTDPSRDWRRSGAATGRGIGGYLRSRGPADWLFFAAALVIGAWLG